MENQIQLYHDATAFWLDQQWKTPRERELKGEIRMLEAEVKRWKSLSPSLKLLEEAMKVAREKWRWPEMEPTDFLDTYLYESFKQRGITLKSVKYV